MDQVTCLWPFVLQHGQNDGYREFSWPVTVAAHHRLWVASSQLIWKLSKNWAILLTKLVVINNDGNGRQAESQPFTSHVWS